MKKFFVPLVIFILLISPVVIATVNQDIGIIRNPRQCRSLMKRVIADTISERDIELFKTKGCFIIHRLKKSTSLECPESVISQLSLRESRIFHIMDLDADKQIGADLVWAEGITGNGVKVAILDTGIDIDHPELQDSYIGGYDFVNNDSIPEDDHGHGTHVAGIITSNGNNADSKGVAPSTEIYMYKVCNADGNCYEDDMIAAMEAAVETDAKVMSISIGGASYKTENCDSDSLAAKVNWVVEQGLTAVIAAGNDGRGVSSPGCASGAIAVGAVDSNNNVVYWSGRGRALDIVAPGVNIYSSIINGYDIMSGTSMSTPHVSGVIALLLETNPSLTTDEIKTALYNTANPANKCYSCRFFWGSYCFGQIEVTCTPEITGAGVVNAYNAYLTVKSEEPECTVDADCDDGLYCNGVETCVTGVCQTGTPVDCSGLSDQCNVGVCDETIDSCVKQPASEGLACDDGLFCNLGETCQSGECTGGSSRDCSDTNECTIDSCEEATDSCVNTPVTDGTSCDDDKFCTINDVCTAGVCGGVTRDCSDGVTCTVDSCDEINEMCTNTPDNSYCDNNLFCDGTETCDIQLDCQTGTSVNCDDGNECTADTCSETLKSCEYIPVADNRGCSGGICCSGTCTGLTCSADIDCDDSDTCTIDTCSYPGTCDALCSYEPITACIDNDNCCPAGCDYITDNDCPESPTTVCGNGICEGQGEDCHTCPADCRESVGWFKFCCGDGICSWIERYICPIDCQ